MDMASAATPVRALPVEDDDETRLAKLRADIDAGDAQWDRGEVVEGEEFIDELISTFHQRHPHATE